MILLSLKDILLVVLEEENVERIKEHDNAEVNIQQVPKLDRLRLVQIAYASPDEMKQISAWALTGENDKALRLLTGGFKFKPKRGDHDFGPTPLVPS